MPSFQHFQSQAEQSPRKPKFSDETFSLSGLMQYAESAKKQSFEALCRLQPLVKTYQSQVQKTSQAMMETEALLQGEEEIPASYETALASVRQGFAEHLGSLQQWMSVLAQKDESQSEKAIADVRKSGKQLEVALMGLSIPE